MTHSELKTARKACRWTQHELARRLGVSQTYVALLESGKRPMHRRLSRKAVRLLNLTPASLPVSGDPFSLPAERLAEQLGALGYPGFSHLRAARKRNPAEVLLSALVQDELESRVTEALPWLLLQYAAMSDETRQWMLDQTRLRGLSNRLGFVVTLAKEVAARSGDTTSERYQSLATLEDELRQSRLDKEDTLCQSSLSPKEREWLRETRPAEAKEWHLLTDWRAEHLQYAA